MGVCVRVEQREGQGSVERGKMISVLQQGTKRGRKLQEHPPVQCTLRIVK